jgi:hypothetical protein
MGALRGDAIVEGLGDFDALADHRRDLVRRQQRTGIDRGRRRGRSMQPRRDQKHDRAQGGQQKPGGCPVAVTAGKRTNISIDHGNSSAKRDVPVYSPDYPKLCRFTKN